MCVHLCTYICMYSSSRGAKKYIYEEVKCIRTKGSVGGKIPHSQRGPKGLVQQKQDEERNSFKASESLYLEDIIKDNSLLKSTFFS